MVRKGSGVRVPQLAALRGQIVGDPPQEEPCLPRARLPRSFHWGPAKARCGLLLASIVCKRSASTVVRRCAGSARCGEDGQYRRDTRGNARAGHGRAASRRVRGSRVWRRARAVPLVGCHPLSPVDAGAITGDGEDRSERTRHGGEGGPTFSATRIPLRFRCRRAGSCVCRRRTFRSARIRRVPPRWAYGRCRVG